MDKHLLILSTSFWYNPHVFNFFGFGQKTYLGIDIGTASIKIAELSKEKVSTPEDVVKPGDVVDVKILRIIPEEQKIGLSIKDVQIEKDAELVKDQKQEETRVTLGDMIAEKERLKAERETSDDEIHPSA